MNDCNLLTSGLFPHCFGDKIFFWNVAFPLMQLVVDLVCHKMWFPFWLFDYAEILSGKYEEDFEEINIDEDVSCPGLSKSFWFSQMVSWNCKLFLLYTSDKIVIFFFFWLRTIAFKGWAVNIFFKGFSSLQKVKSQNIIQRLLSVNAAAFFLLWLLLYLKYSDIDSWLWLMSS